MDPMVAGTTNTRQGGLVGLPRYMLEENFDWKKIRLKTNFNKMFKGFKIPENISQEDQQELKKWLSVSEQEKQFLMSFCLAKASSWFAVMTMVVPSIFWAFHYAMAYRVNNKMRLLERNRFIRLAIQGRGVISFIVITFISSLLLQACLPSSLLACTSATLTCPTWSRTLMP